MCFFIDIHKKELVSKPMWFDKQFYTARSAYNM